MIINKPAIQSGRVYARKQYQSFLNENNNSVKESDVLKMKRKISTKQINRKIIERGGIFF